MSLRVGFVGAGNMARAHAEGWGASPDNVVAVLSPGSNRVDAFASDLGARVVDDFASLADMVDVIDICTPTNTHGGYIAEGAAAGLHIVCEKPLARTGPEAFAAVEACRNAGVHLLVAHVLRFFPEYARARDLAVSGVIGDVGVIRLKRSTYMPERGTSWFTDMEKSGGVVHDLMIHDIDYARWVAGPIDRVYARRAGSANHVLATLDHASGAITHIEGSWAYPQGSFETGLEIAGSDGLIQRHAAEPFTSSVSAGGETSKVPQAPSSDSPYVAQILHFSDVLHGEATPIVTDTDGTLAVAACDAIAESISTNRPVIVEVP